VTAVLKDLPSNTHLTAEIHRLARVARRTDPPEPVQRAADQHAATYFRLKPGASTRTMQPRTAQFLETRLSAEGDHGPDALRSNLHLSRCASCI
jgi:hypothetical protein